MSGMPGPSTWLVKKCGRKLGKSSGDSCQVWATQMDMDRDKKYQRLIFLKTERSDSVKQTE